jgi:hypothetical protein
MEISDNCFGLFTEFSFWIDSIPVTLKRPTRVIGEYKVPNDNDVIIEVDPDDEWKDSIMNDEGEILTEEKKEEIVTFIRGEISEGRIKLPCSLEYNTFDFKKEKYFDIS